jgi:hypothetical protein
MGTEVRAGGGGASMCRWAGNGVGATTDRAMVGTTATSSPSEGLKADLAAGTLVDPSAQNFAHGPCEMPDESSSGQSGQPALWSMDAGCEAAFISPMPAMPDMLAGAMTQALTRPVASANSQTSSTLAARRRIRACWVNIGVGLMQPDFQVVDAKRF